MSKKDNNQTIMVAAAVIAIALVFNGFAQLKGGGSGGDLQEEIEKGIETFIEKQQEAARQEQEAANQPQEVSGDFNDDDAVLGNPNAPVTLIEFSDYECPFCKRHFDQTMPLIKKNYIDTGKVKMIFRDFPLSFHPRAQVSAMAAECVGDELGDKAYFEYHDLLFSNAPASLTDENLKKYALQVGANEGRYNDCLSSEKFLEEVQKDLSDGQRAGITGTPGFLINNKRISGAQPYSAFEALIEEALNN